MLTKVEYRRLQPDLELVRLKAHEVLYTPGVVANYIYFPNDCVVSLLFNVNAHRTVEIAMEGNESVVGILGYLGGPLCFNLAVVRHTGTAMRLTVDALRQNTRTYNILQDLLDKSVHAFLTQVAQSAVCSRFHRVDERLARWLLMTSDRVGPHEIRATQESISRSLGMRRSGVTASASQLQKQNVIEYRRGRIEIIDEPKLHSAACACYGIIKRQYDSFLR